MSDERKTLGSPVELLTPNIERTRKRFLDKYKQHGEILEPLEPSVTMRELKRRNTRMRKQLLAFGKDPAKVNEYEPTEVFRKQVRIFAAMNFSRVRSPYRKGRARPR